MIPTRASAWPLLAALAACASAAPPDAPTPDAKVIRAGCRQGQCSWLELASVDTVATRAEGDLRRIDGRRGISVHLDGSIPDSPPAAIEWEPERHAEYAFCSTVRPAYAFHGHRDRLIVHFFDPFALSGYQMPSAALYMRICHGRAELPDEAGLRALGYRPGTRSEQVETDDPGIMSRF